jgi:hypothetical protein
MKIDELHQLWETDCNIDRSELGEESLRIPQLHSKYFKLFSNERLLLRKLESDYNTLFTLKSEYYNGTISEEDLKANGWEPFLLKILKTDVQMYMRSDPDLAKIQLRIDMQNEKVEFLESIIKSLPARGYQIKSAIDWVKFTHGQ